MTETHIADELDQLRRTAEMFEMILQCTPDAIATYYSLRDVYRQIGEPVKARAVMSRLAEWYFCGKMEKEALAEFMALYQEDPTDTAVAARLVQLGHDPVDLQLRALRKELARLDEHVAQAHVARDEAADQSRSLATEAETQARASTADGLRSLDDEIQHRTSAFAGQLHRTRRRLFDQIATEAEEAARRYLDGDSGRRIPKRIAKAERILASVERTFSRRVRQAEDAARRPFETDLDAFRRQAEADIHARADTVLEEGRLQALDHLHKAEAAIEELERRRDALRQETHEIEARTRTSKAPATPTPFAAPPAAPATSSTAAKPSPPPARMVEKSRRLGELLVERRIITEKNLETALARQQETHEVLGKILVGLGYASEPDILNCLAIQAKVPYLPLANYDLNPDAAKRVPKEIALKHGCLPIDLIANSLLITMPGPLAADAKAEIERCASGLKVKYYISSQSEIEERLKQLYP